MARLGARPQRLLGTVDRRLCTHLTNIFCLADDARRGRAQTAQGGEAVVAAAVVAGDKLQLTCGKTPALIVGSIAPRPQNAHSRQAVVVISQLRLGGPQLVHLERHGLARSCEGWEGWAKEE